MSYLDRFNPMRRGTHRHTITGEAMHLAVYGGASFGFGYLQQRYRQKASLLGVPADLAAGVGLTALSMVAGGARGVVGSLLVPLARDVGRAGVGAFFHTWGSGAGAKAGGVARLLIQQSDVAKAKAALPNATILGVSQKAPPGDWMSARELRALANA